MPVKPVKAVKAVPASKSVTKTKGRVRGTLPPRSA
jgi:hypothetical protein